MDESDLFAERLRRLAAEGRDSSEITAELYATVYEELRRMASAIHPDADEGRVVRPTELVHLAFVKLVEGRPIPWQSRQHFFCVAARAMRQVLVDLIRSRRAQKHGGQWKQVSLLTDIPIGGTDLLDVLALDTALERFRRQDPRAASIIELSVFAGLSRGQCAEVLGISSDTVGRDLAYARVWLSRELR